MVLAYQKQKEGHFRSPWAHLHLCFSSDPLRYAPDYLPKLILSHRNSSAVPLLVPIPSPSLYGLCAADPLSS